MITSGCSPALANSVASATGSLSIRTFSRVSPDSVRRTMTLRRRCRSMPTYCCSCSTGVSFCRFRVGFATPSVLRTPGPGRREDSRWAFGFDRLELATLIVGTGLLLMLGARARCDGPVPSRRSDAALLHHISGGGAYLLSEPQSVVRWCSEYGS